MKHLSHILTAVCTIGLLCSCSTHRSLTFAQIHEEMKGELSLPTLEEGYCYYNVSGAIYAVYRNEQVVLQGYYEGKLREVGINDIPEKCLVYCYADKTRSWNVLRKFLVDLGSHNINTIYMAYENDSHDDSSKNAHQAVRSIKRKEVPNCIELKLLNNGHISWIKSNKTTDFNSIVELLGFLDKDTAVILSAESEVSIGDYLFVYSNIYGRIRTNVCMPLDANRSISVRTVDEWIKEM